MKNKLSVAVVACALIAVTAACSFTTAKIGKMEFGKNDKASPATTSFDIADKIFAVTEVTGAMGKHKMKFKVSYEDVPGKKKGEEALAKEIDFEGSASPFLSFTVPAGGTYKVDAALVDSDGKEIDKKSGTVTVKGAPAASTDSSNKDTDTDDSKEDK